MNKQILIALTIIVVIGGAAWLARPQSQTGAFPTPMANAADALKALEPTFDFGTISMANGTVERRIAVKNTSDKPVTVGKVYSSCMCTSVALSVGDRKYGPFGMAGMGYIARVNDTIAPGEEAVLVIAFDPTAHGPAGVGRIQREVTMEYDGGRPVAVSFTANVTP